MRPAAEALETVLAGIEVGAPDIPVLHNVSTDPAGEPGEIRAALVQQLWRPVRWSDTVLRLVTDGVERFAECGPGKVLAGLNRRISRPSDTVALTDAAALRTTLQKWS
jgi:[acyl-carrier-protein] S-malonyltransferase